MLKTITESTLIPVGLAVITIGGASMWVTQLKAQLDVDNSIIAELRRASEGQTKLIYEINSRLSRLEWKLESPKYTK